jgi:carbonic anhydrase/acetyltransferase-like protein (isoleucine patch superfamily)
MKKAFYVLLLLCSYTLSAQTPQFIHYQAVIRDGNGAVLSNQTIGLKLEITQGQNTYTEVRTLTTNNLGLVNLNVGSLPAPNSIPFSSINWADGNASLLTWYDPTNTNTNWQYIGSSSIASVPYALHAANVFSGDFNDLTNVPTIDTSATNELQTISSQGDTILLSAGGFIYFERFSGDFADLNGVPNLDTSSTNELQSISQNGDTISMSKGGGSVVISSFSGDFGDLTNVPPIDTSNVNELQVLSISGDTLYLSNGGFVVLPLSSKAEKLDDLSDAKTLNNSLGLGVHALHSMDSNAYNNVAVGEFSLENLQGAGDNTAVGTRSMRLNTIGGYNTAVGFEALYSNTVGQQNTAIGNNAMWENLSGFQNTALGSHALMNSRVGQGITAVGFGALRNANSSGPNDALGKNSLKNLTVGTSNVALGVNSLLTLGADSTVEQYRNTVIGSSALMRMEHGTNNIGIGNEVGSWLTGGSYNVIVGGAGSASSGARIIHNNTILGYAAGDKLSSGSNGNTILGNEALASLSEGSLNIGIGWHAADGITKGGNNIFIGGPNSGPLRVLPINSNVAIGMGTGSSLDSNAYANVFMGENAGNMMRGGSDNVAIGHAALQSSPKGGYNVAVGTQAMQMSDVETSSNTAIGAQSLVNVRSVENTAIGKGSQNQTTTGGGNTSVGASSLTSNTSGANNVAMGVNSLYNNTSGFSNTSIGTFSLNSNQTGQENVAIGFSAMAGNTTGSLNTAVGLYTLHGYQGLTGNNNTALGAHVLSNTTSGEGNAGLGYWVFPNLKTGSYNIGIGNNVGSNIRGTNENIIIGHEANVGDSLISNSIAIGFQAIVKSSNAIQLGNSVTEKVETSGRFEGRGATLRDSTSSGDNAILRLSSNSKGFVFPTMTFDERLSVFPEIGMAIYCKNCGPNGQLQIFNGSVWTDFSGAPAAPKQLSIGDTAFGGVVAYILTPADSGYSQNIQHGIIIASSDLTYGMQWGCMTLFPTSPNKLRGEYNQQQFMSTCQSSPTIAMGAVANLILNGKTDWVLPTKDDLAAIYMNRSILSQYLSGGTYWSSTNNVNGAGAWCMNLSNGYVATFLKNDNYHRTKPVRYF